jgi:hypothetical protein
MSYELRIALFFLATPPAYRRLPSAYFLTTGPLPCRVSSENPAEADSMSLDKRENIG